MKYDSSALVGDQEVDGWIGGSFPIAVRFSLCRVESSASPPLAIATTRYAEIDRGDLGCRRGTTRNCAARTLLACDDDVGLVAGGAMRGRFDATLRMVRRQSIR